MSAPVTDFASYKAYFKDIATPNITGSLKSLKDFAIGGTERIVSGQRSKLSYPCLWLEYPDLKLKDNKGGDFSGNFNGAFAIIKNCPQDDWDAQDDAMQETYLIAMDVISKMIQDRYYRSNDSKFYFDPSSITIDPINTMMTDNDYGWRVAFQISNNVPVCFNQLNWN
jgi:hypothetical protein